MCSLQLQSFTAKPSKSPLLPCPPLGFLKTFVESHGVFDLIIFEQTQDMHYSSPIPVYGLHTHGDQYGAQHTFAHTVLCPIDGPTPRKVIRFFFHKTASHPPLSWLMHKLVLQAISPWNPHALKNTLLSFLLCNNQMQGKNQFSITWLGKVYSTFMNKP